MFAQTLMFAGLLIAAPPDVAGPRLEKGLEVRWAGTFTEASFRPGVRNIRTYDVDTRLFVIDVGEGGADVALFTRVFQQPTKKSTELPAGVVRIELARVGTHGRLHVMPSPADPDNPEPKIRPWPIVQLQGLPSHEGGMFVEAPDGLTKVGQAWVIEEAGRPPIAWKVTDTESVRGQPGFKVVGEQKTDNYYEGHVRQAEWRRQDTLSVLHGNNFATRFKRVIERREPEADDLAFRSVLTMEQSGRIVYSGRLFEERRDEAVHAAGFTAVLDRLLGDGGRSGPKPFEALARRVDTYQADHASSDTVPFREAIQAVRKRAESAARGNLPPTTPSDESAVTAGPLAIGRAVPDIVLSPVAGTAETRLSKFKGRPVLLAYFQPTAPSAAAVLKLAQRLHAGGRTGVMAVPLVIGDPEAAQKLLVDLGLTVPVFDGSTVYKAHGLEGTPVFIAIDAEGVVRHVARGWDAETAAAVTRAVGLLSK